MPLPTALSKCLFDLTLHCENLQAQADMLLCENDMLQKKLALAKTTENVSSTIPGCVFEPVVPCDPHPPPVAKLQALRVECESVLSTQSGDQTACSAGADGSIDGVVDENGARKSLKVLRPGNSNRSISSRDLPTSDEDNSRSLTPKRTATFAGSADATEDEVRPISFQAFQTRASSGQIRPREDDIQEKSSPTLLNLHSQRPRTVGFSTEISQGVTVLAGHRTGSRDLKGSKSTLDIGLPTTNGGVWWSETAKKEAVEALGKNMDTLAAARLGMLAHHGDGDGDEEPDTLQNFLDALKAFDEEDGTGSWDHRTVLQRIVKSFAFKAVCILAIAANTLYIGASADHQVKASFRRLNGDQNDEPQWRVAEIVFVSWFAIELALRIAVDKKGFFIGSDWRWNMFDFLLVCNSIVELILPVASNLSFMRIFRVFRLVRVVKIVRTVTALKSLRTMVFALMNSFVCLLWAFVMILLVMFVFGVIIEHAVAGYFDSVDAADIQQMAIAQTIAQHFGNLSETMVSLFASITGGNDWMFYGDMLRELKYGNIYFIIFAFYISFCLIGVLNVVTGIFVDSAVCTRTQDEVVECFTDDVKRTSEEVRRIFKEADKDKSGTINFQELSTHLQTPWVRAYFSGLDIDPSEATIIFTLMDTDGSGEVSIDEFVDGTMKLKGHAKNIDVLSLMFDSVRFSIKFNTFCCFIEDQLRELKQAMLPGAPSTERMFALDEAALAHSTRITKQLRRPSLNSPRPSYVKPESPMSSRALENVRKTVTRLVT